MAGASRSRAKDATCTIVHPTSLKTCRAGRRVAGAVLDKRQDASPSLASSHAIPPMQCSQRAKQLMRWPIGSRPGQGSQLRKYPRPIYAEFDQPTEVYLTHFTTAEFLLHELSNPDHTAEQLKGPTQSDDHCKPCNGSGLRWASPGYSSGWVGLIGLGSRRGFLGLGRAEGSTSPGGQAGPAKD
ncbi:hypothetical protein HOY80DRAFT_1062260 [Tuber brumale]|nr:hypothetical protein HOY80DRAFT_1062260 [Tuber brumale]